MTLNYELNVKLGSRTYPILIGSDLFSDPTHLFSYIHEQQTLIVTHETLVDHPILLKLQRHLQTLTQLDMVVLPDGEAHKNLATLELIFDQLLEKKHKRSTTLIAFGGGVIGDLTGFAAATYQRGVNFIQVPTTLLAQVDSSVGGKTGVNHRLGKNMIGAFYQPQSVFIDLETLFTLPDREFSAGLAEVIKYGLIEDVEFFDWLCDHMEALLDRDRATLSYAIFKSCEIKAKIVALDEREENIRAHLNLGHTFGHAIEHQLGYGTCLHGEAVALGIMLAAIYSMQQGMIANEEIPRIRNLLQKAKLPVVFPSSLIPMDLFEAMQRDKKNKAQGVRLILLEKIGQACIVETSLSDLKHFLEHYSHDKK